MDKTKLFKRLISFTTASVAAFSFGTLMLASGDDSMPSVHFGNEKVTGLTVTKEIYKDTSSVKPLREGSDEDKTYYTANRLSEDEFRMFLLEGSSENSLSPRQGEVYTRSNKYGSYYCCPMYSDENVTGVDLIIRPYDSKGNYEVCYFDAGGEHHEYSDKVGQAQNDDGYAAMDISDKFKRDYGSSYVTKNFSTWSDGSFFMYDGRDSEQVFFKKIRSTYYYVTEDVAALERINDDKIAEKLTGVYNTGVQALTSPDSPRRYNASEANSFLVKNYFDKPNDVFTLKKSVNYLYADNIFNDEFTFELLINDESPGGYSYTKKEGSKIVEEGVFDYGNAPATVTLKGGQSLEISGIMKNSFIEAREILTDSEGVKLHPDYSPVTEYSSIDGKSYTLVEENGRKYIRWDGVYKKQVVDTAEFKNVPDVFAVSKIITNSDEMTEPEPENYEFEFRIQKFDGNDYKNLAENAQMKYYIKEADENYQGDDSKNGAPYVTDNGTFRLKNGQTALFIGLESGEKYRVSETKALLNNINVTADFIMDSNVYEINARPETVSDSTVDDIKTFRNEYNPPSGISVSKMVEDKYGRADPDAEYSFKIINENGIVVKTFSLKDGETQNFNDVSSGNYKVIEIDPNSPGEDQLFATDVVIGNGNVKHFNIAGTDNSTDIESDQFNLGIGDSKSVNFTNKTTELKYYFDIEKILFVDKNVHDSDEAQRFMFKIERFAENETDFSDKNVLETFYTTFNCTDDMTYNGTGITGYNYEFYHDADETVYPYSYFKYENGTAKIQKIYGTGEYDKYQYPCGICRGSKTVTVTKKGIYRISEINWSGNKYSFWKGSNIYKGYGNCVADKGSDGSVMFSVSDVMAQKFENVSAEINGSTVYRPTASFTNSETEYAYLSSQSYAENIIKHGD
ncbi:MAG: hypothetical protein K5979_10635 [Ruminococcus sp.]|nr:hypothetical protein [Ruminococcus sp.]